MAFPPATLSTSRLRLRIPVFSDADAIFAAYAQDAEVSRYVTWRPHQSVIETRAFVGGVIKSWNTGEGEQAWVLERAEDGRLLGMVGTRRHHGIALGYVLARAHWGRGYMTEAVRVVCDVALAEPDVYRVWAFCDVDNVASARVMEKAGMAREGRLARFSPHPNVGEAPRDCWVYARVR